MGIILAAIAIGFPKRTVHVKNKEFLLKTKIKYKHFLIVIKDGK